MLKPHAYYHVNVPINECVLVFEYGHMCHDTRGNVHVSNPRQQNTHVGLIHVTKTHASQVTMLHFYDSSTCLNCIFNTFIFISAQCLATNEGTDFVMLLMQTPRQAQLYLYSSTTNPGIVIVIISSPRYPQQNDIQVNTMQSILIGYGLSASSLIATGHGIGKAKTLISFIFPKNIEAFDKPTTCTYSNSDDGGNKDAAANDAYCLFWNFSCYI